MGFYTSDGWTMRITGLNFENAMFAIVVSIGVSLEKNKIWKLIMTASVILSLSRTGWLMILAYYFIILIKNFLIKNVKVNKKKLIKSITIIIIICIIFGIAYVNSQVLRIQVKGIINRITDQDSNNISAKRHILYYPYGIFILFYKSNILQILFGYGMRCSGVAFTQNPSIFGLLGGTQLYETAWALECDTMGLLLGGGIITTLIYYCMLYSLIRNKNEFSNTIFIIFVGGITYHFHSISYIIIIFLLSTIIQCEKNKRIKEESSEKSK